MESKVNSILNNPTLSDREKVDELLFMDAMLYANTGIDSTQYEHALNKANSILIYEAIKTLDYDMGESFLLLTNKN
tara:strand:+ start:5861 stop:6088 length:228 start_codon:yes stop_codon:yes gene_type:complete